MNMNSEPGTNFNPRAGLSDAFPVSGLTRDLIVGDNVNEALAAGTVSPGDLTPGLRNLSAFALDLQRADEQADRVFGVTPQRSTTVEAAIRTIAAARRDYAGRSFSGEDV
jgi:hypothetical protein